MAVSVRIGRNVGNEPLSHGDWVDFQSDVVGLFVFTANGPTLVLGEGEWDGVAEENATITGTLQTHTVTGELARLARQFGQDAIAIQIGEGTSWLLITRDCQLQQGWEE